MMMSSANTGFVLDIADLESMKRRARENPQQSQEAVAQEFESLFIHMMLKRMREATPQDGLFESGQTRMAQSLADEQLASHLAKPGIGLAQALLAQMQRYQGGAAATGPADETPASAFVPLDAPLRVHGGATATRSEGRVGMAGLLDGIRGAAQYVTSAASAMVRPVDGGATLPADTPAHVASFVDKLGRAARSVAQASGLPLRLIMGQAALESGWGKREIRMADGSNSYNLFGIKATGGWQGKVANIVTTEYENGVARKVRQPFRAYDSYEHALGDYARLITQSERYQDVVRARSDTEAAREIQAAGYATDPAYADKLIRIMERLPV